MVNGLRYEFSIKYPFYLLTLYCFTFYLLLELRDDPPDAVAVVVQLLVPPWIRVGIKKLTQKKPKNNTTFSLSNR